MLIVSDHALLRLFERGHGLDVEGCRAELAARLQRASSAAERIGPTQYVIALDGLRYQVRDGHVVTVLSEDMAGQNRRQGIARA